MADTTKDGDFIIDSPETQYGTSSRSSEQQVAELLKALDQTKELIENLLQHTSTDQGRGTNRATCSNNVPRQKSWWGKHCWPHKRRIVYRNITLVTVVLQFLNLIILTLLDVLPRRNIEEQNIVMASSTTMIVLQVLNLFILILATGRLAKQVIKHNVNSFFLAQSYLATLLLFSGIYTLTYRLDKHSWRFLNENLTEDPIQVFALYVKFLFYSISTATLCGSDNALPVGWYNHLFAGTQMLLSFCYFASILGVALTPLQSTPPCSQNRQTKADNNQDKDNNKETPTVTQTKYRANNKDKFGIFESSGWKSGNENYMYSNHQQTFPQLSNHKFGHNCDSYLTLTESMPMELGSPDENGLRKMRSPCQPLKYQYGGTMVQSGMTSQYKSTTSKSQHGDCHVQEKCGGSCEIQVDSVECGDDITFPPQRCSNSSFERHRNKERQQIHQDSFQPWCATTSTAVNTFNQRVENGTRDKDLVVESVSNKDSETTLLIGRGNHVTSYQGVSYVNSVATVENGYHSSCHDI